VPGTRQNPKRNPSKRKFLPTFLNTFAVANTRRPTTTTVGNKRQAKSKTTATNHQQQQQQPLTTTIKAAWFEIG